MPTSPVTSRSPPAPELGLRRIRTKMHASQPARAAPQLLLSLPAVPRLRGHGRPARAARPRADPTGGGRGRGHRPERRGDPRPPRGSGHPWPGGGAGHRPTGSSPAWRARCRCSWTRCLATGGPAAEAVDLTEEAGGRDTRMLCVGRARGLAVGGGAEPRGARVHAGAGRGARRPGVHRARAGRLRRRAVRDRVADGLRRDRIKIFRIISAVASAHV
jgi:hypothetical protein